MTFTPEATMNRSRNRPPLAAPSLVLVALCALAACSEGGDGGPTAPSEPIAGSRPLPALAAGEYLFVLNRGSRDVSVLSADGGYAEVGRIPLPDAGGADPAGLDVSPDGILYVTFPDSTSTVVALGSDGTELARAAVQGWSADVTVDARRGTVAVATGRGVEFLEPRTLASRGRVATGRGRNGAWNVEFTPEGASVVVSNSLGDEIVFVSPAELEVLGKVAVSAFPEDAAVAHGRVYVAGRDADRLDAVAVGGDSVLGSYPVANGPSSVEAPEGSGLVYVAAKLSGDVTVLDAETGEERGRWTLGHRIPDIATDAAAALLFVCDPSSDRIQVLDAASGMERGGVQVGRSPSVLKAVTLR